MSALLLTTQPYREAIRDAIASRLPSGMLLNDLDIALPRKMLSGQVRVTVRIKPESYLKNGWSWYGSTEMKHGQIDLSDLFLGCDLTYDETILPDRFTTEDILQQIFVRYLIHFDPTDHYHDQYFKNETTSVVIAASPQSFRYKGQVTFQSASSVDNRLLTNEGDPITTAEGLPITI
jgi:hypothetical protein